MNDDTPTFGHREEGRTYRRRPGAYALIVRDDKVLIVEEESGWFLPGGGLEVGESPVEALHRELLEETGYHIEAPEPLTQVREHLIAKADQKAWTKECHIFTARLGDRPQSGHCQLRWVDAREAADMLATASFRWVVEYFVGGTNGDRDSRGYPTIDELVADLELAPHPEGGFFRETWRSELTLAQTALPGHPGERSAGTSIIYLLPHGEVSALHRVRSDELWLHQLGDPLELAMGADADGELTRHALGWPPVGRLQALVPAGWWQTATPLGGPAGYSLVACVVVPGFDFEDFEMLSSEL